MPERRNKYEIYSELLDTVARRRSCKLTNASYGANLPVDRAKAMLTFLASRGFVSQNKVAGSTTYAITKRGLEYLETFKNMRKLFAALDEQHSLPAPTSHGEARRISEVEANLALAEDHVLADEEVKLGITVANVGDRPVILKSVEQIIPSNFQVVYIPDNFSLKGDSIFAEDITLDPGSKEEIRLGLRAPREGAYFINPRVISLSDDGEELVTEPPPAAIRVAEAIVPRHVSTGYKDLDNLLLGGIPDKYAMILLSPPCDERDLLTLKFLREGVKQKETTVYFATDVNMIRGLSLEASPGLHVFVCNPQADAIIDDRSNVVKLKGVDNLTDVSIAFTSASRRMGRKPGTPKRACIGILSDILLEHGAVRTRKWLTGFLSELKSQGFTSVVLLNPQMHPPEEVQAVLDPFEGEVDIYTKQTKEGAHKFLRIRRMFNQRYLENEMRLVKEKLRT